MALSGGVKIDYPDIIIILVYFVLVIAVGIWSSTRNRGSVGGYFLAGRSMHWILVGASLFASNIGSGHFVGLAGSGASSGIGIATFELNAIFVLLVLGWVFVPVYVAAGVYTMPEYLRKRFGGQRIRLYLAFLALILYIFTKISADLYAGAVFIEQAIGWNIYLAILILLLVAAVFTITGGLTAVIWTDFIQTVIMIVGAFVLMILSFITLARQLPEWSNMSMLDMIQIAYAASIANTTLYGQSNCSMPSEYYWKFIQPHDSLDLPWTGIIFGLTISSVWYWCTDQVIVQRALAAKSLYHVKLSCVAAGYLKILPLWIMVFPGMIARILFPDEIACGDPKICKNLCGSERGCTNIAYPLLVIRVMPVGVRGLMLAVMMSSLMSSLTSIFNSSSTIFTMDVWRKFRKKSSEIELMIVGRLFVVFLVAVSVVWIPVVRSAPELFHYIQAITSFLAPPICAVFLLGVLWSRINEHGAFWSLMIGLAVGLVRFIWEYTYTVPPCGEEEKDKRPDIIAKVHYLHFGCILFAIVAIAATTISLLTKPIDPKHLVRLTFWSRHDTEQRVDINLDSEKQTSEKQDDTGKPRVEEMTVDDTGSKSELPERRFTDAPLQPLWKRAIRWICGIERMDAEHAQTFTEEDQQRLEKTYTSIEEVPKYRIISNVNALIIMTVAIFIWGFYF